MSRRSRELFGSVSFATAALIRPRSVDISFRGIFSMRCCQIVCVILTSLFAWPYSMAGGDYRFQSENLALISDIKNIFVGAGLCEDISHCSEKDFVFSRPTAWGLELEIYGIRDPMLIKKIDLTCAEYFHGSKQKISILVRFFSATKTEDVKASIFSKPKPIITINREHANVQR